MEHTAIGIGLIFSVSLSLFLFVLLILFLAITTLTLISRLSSFRRFRVRSNVVRLVNSISR